MPPRIVFMLYTVEDLAMTSICFWLCRELAKRGRQMTLIAVSRHRRFRPSWRKQDGVRILLTPRGISGRWHGGGWGFHDILTRLCHLVREPYDVLVGFDFRANVYVPFRAMKGRIPLRIALWGDRWGDGGLAEGASRFTFQRRLEAKWEKAMILEADGVVSTSQKLMEMGRKWGIPDQRICWIPHGSPTDLIHPVPRKVARKRIGLAPNQPVIGYLGHSLERLDTFFPVLRRLIHRHPGTAVLCIGAHSKTDRKKVEQAGLAHHFHFPGFVPTSELSDWLGCADLFLIPPFPNPVNDYYRYPGKLGDYLAAGRPIVAPDVGETAHILRVEKIGLIAHPDLSDLEERICQLIEDRTLAEELGTRARRAAEERFAWPVLADRFERFIDDLRGPHS